MIIGADKAGLLSKQAKESKFLGPDMFDRSTRQTQESLPASWCLRAWAAPPWREAVGAAPPRPRRFPLQERLERKPSRPPHHLCRLPPTGGRLPSPGQSSPWQEGQRHKTSGWPTEHRIVSDVACWWWRGSTGLSVPLLKSPSSLEAFILQKNTTLESRRQENKCTTLQLAWLITAVLVWLKILFCFASYSLS